MHNQLQAKDDCWRIDALYKLQPNKVHSKKMQNMKVHHGEVHHNPFPALVPRRARRALSACALARRRRRSLAVESAISNEAEEAEQPTLAASAPVL